jgi:hypothetical protein
MSDKNPKAIRPYTTRLGGYEMSFEGSRTGAEGNKIRRYKLMAANTLADSILRPTQPKANQS